MATLLGFGDDIRKKNNLIPNRFQQSKVVTNYGQAAPAQPNIQSVNKTPTPNTSSAKNSVSSRAAGTLRSLSNFNVDRPMPNTQQTSLNVQNISTNKPVENNFKTIQSKQSQGILERGPWGQNGPTTNNPIPSLNTLSNANFNAPINNASKDPLAQTNILNAQLSDGKTINQNRYNNLLSKIAERENKKASDASYDKWLKNADEETMLGQATKAIENGDKDWLQRVVNKSDVAKTSSKLRDLLTNDAARINFNSRYNVNFTPEEYAKATSKYDLSKYTSENSAPQSFLDKQIKKIVGGTNTDTLENDVNEAMRLINRAKQYGDTDAAKLEYSGNREDLVKAYQLINTLANLSEMYGVENLGIGGYNARQLNDLINDASKRSTSAEVNSPFLSAETIGEFGKQIGEFGQQVADRIDEFGAKNLGPVSDIQRFLVTLPTGSAEAMLSSPNNLAMGAVEFGNSNKNIQDFAKLAGTMVNEGINLMPLLEIGGSGALLGSGKRLAKDIAAGNITKQAASDTARRTLGTVLKDIFKDAAQEGIEEGVQYIAEKLGEDGNFDNFKFEELAQNVLGGAAGGAVMSGMSTAIDEYARPVIGNLVNSFKENGIGLSVKDVSQDNLTAGKSIKNTNQDTNTNTNTAKTREDALNTLEEVGLTEQQAINNRGEFLDLYRKGIKTESDFNNEVYKKDGSVKKKYSEYDVDTLHRLFRANDALLGENQIKSEIKTEQSLRQNEQKIANQMNGEDVDAEQKVRTPEEITRDLDRAYADLDAGYGDEAKIRQLESELDAARAEQGNPEFYSDENNVEKVEPKTEETPESLMEQLNEETSKPDKQQDKKKIKQLTEKLTNLIESPETNNQVEIENENKVSGTEELPNDIKVSKPAEETAQRLREEPLKVETEIPAGDKKIKVEETIQPADDYETTGNIKETSVTKKLNERGEGVTKQFYQEMSQQKTNSKAMEDLQNKINGTKTKLGEDKTFKVLDDISKNAEEKGVDNLTRKEYYEIAAAYQMARNMNTSESLLYARNLAEIIADYGRQSGQDIAYINEIYRQTDELLRRSVEKYIDNAGKLDEKTQSEVDAHMEKINEARKTYEDLKSDVDKASKEDGISKNKEYLNLVKKRDAAKATYLNAIADLGQYASKVAPGQKSNFYHSLIRYNRAAMLSGIPTQTKNMVSNMINQATNSTVDAIAAQFDKIIGLVTGRRTVSGTVRGSGRGLVEGTKEAYNVLKTGRDAGSKYDEGNVSGVSGEYHNKNKLTDRTIGRFTRGVYRVVSAGDKPVRRSAEYNMLYKVADIEARNKGLKGQAREDYITRVVTNPTKAQVAMAAKYGDNAVFAKDNALSDAMGKFYSIKLGKSNTTVGDVVAPLAPFVKVPINIAKAQLNLIPGASLLKTGATTLNSAIKGKPVDKVRLQADIAKGLAKTGIGLGLFAIGSALAEGGSFYGDYPSDEEERKRWEAEGIKPNSIKIGNNYFQVGDLLIFSLPMAIGARYTENRNRGMDDFNALANSLGDTATSILENNPVSDLVTNSRDLLDAALSVKDDPTKLASVISDKIVSLIPNLTANIASSVDPYQRDTDKSSPLSELVDKAKSKSLIFRQTLDKRVDNYGNELENNTPNLNGMLDPFKVSSNNERSANDNVIQEVRRLAENADRKSVDDYNAKLIEKAEKEGKKVSGLIKDTNVTPTYGAVNSVKMSDGSEYKLTTEQKNNYEKELGTRTYNAYKEVMNSDRYKQATDAEKVKLLENAKSNVTSGLEAQLEKQIRADNNAGAQNGPEFQFKNDKSAFAVRSVDINNNVSKSTKDMLTKYSEMTSDEWDKYKKENNSAEYDYAKAKFENDKANGKLTQAQIVNKEAELKKLSVSKDYSYDIRDAYSLAGTKSKMQALLDGLDEDTRATTVDTLNSLNRAMYDAGVISASTYKTRKNAINNTTSAKSGSGSRGGRSSTRPAGTISSEEMSTLNKLAKALSETNPIKVGSNAAPANNISTARKMQQTKLSNGRKQSYGSSSKISVKKGIA